MWCEGLRIWCSGAANRVYTVYCTGTTVHHSLFINPIEPVSKIEPHQNKIEINPHIKHIINLLKEPRHEPVLLLLSSYRC